MHRALQHSIMVAGMVSYLIRRLLWMVVVVFGVSIVVFSLIHITPGDPPRSCSASIRTA